MKPDDYIEKLHALREEHARETLAMTQEERIDAENAVLEQFLRKHGLQYRLIASPVTHEQVA